MSGRFTGVLGPLTTPFRADESLDTVSLQSNIRAHLAAGLDGVLVAGSTGEAALLDEAERRRAVEAAREVVPGDRILLVGTGAESTRQCIARCRDAGVAGGDAALVVSPHYYSGSMSSAALHAHFSRVADESPVPILLYNIPKYAHFRLEPDLVARLARHPNILGMKDSAGDMECFARYLEAQGATFDVLTGHGGTFATALRLGARGGILAVALFAADLAIEVWKAHREGRTGDGDEAQRRLVPLAAEIVARMGVPGVKVALDRTGYRGGPVRLPLLPTGEQDAVQVGELLQAAGATAGSRG
jgi:4-hydroxy-2-oxoglutarate aldolase